MMRAVVVDTKKYCVYSHTNKINGKVYVGQTCDKDKRFYDGKYKSCILFYRALQKYGGLKNGFITTILEDGLTKEEADEKEVFYINKYQSIKPEFGYNICEGGSGVRNKHTDEWKENHSKRMSGANNPNYGKHWDENHKKILSDKRKGKTRQREQWEKDKIKQTHQNMKHYNDKCVRCITTNEIFQSQRECARVLTERTGMKFKGFEIGKVCKGEYSQTHGYTFEYSC